MKLLYSTQFWFVVCRFLIVWIIYSDWSIVALILDSEWLIVALTGPYEWCPLSEVPFKGANTLFGSVLWNCYTSLWNIF